MMTLPHSAMSGDTCRVMHRHFDHNVGLTSTIAVSPDGGRYAVATRDADVIVCSSDNGNELLVLTGHREWVRTVCYSPDGDRLLTAAGDPTQSVDHTARIWDAQSGDLLHTLEGYKDDLSCAAFSPDGDIVVTGGNDSTIRIWDANTGDTIRTIRTKSFCTQSIAVSPDGEYILAGFGFYSISPQDCTVRIWSLASGDSVCTLSGQKNLVKSVAFSPDGSQVLSGARDSSVWLWNIAEEDTARTFIGHKSAVTAVAFSSDAEFVLSGSEDKTVQLWERSGGAHVRTFIADGNVMDARFSPDDKKIFARSDYDIYIWNSDGSVPAVARRGAASGKTAPDMRCISRGTFVVTGTKGPCELLFVRPDGRILHRSGAFRDIDGTAVGRSLVRCAAGGVCWNIRGRSPGGAAVSGISVTP